MAVTQECIHKGGERFNVARSRTTHLILKQSPSLLRWGQFYCVYKCSLSASLLLCLSLCNYMFNESRKEFVRIMLFRLFHSLH